MKKEREDKLPEHIETKTVLKVTKILKDRVLRRTKNEKGNELQNAVIKQYPDIAISLQEIQKIWAPLSNLQNISEKIMEIEQEVKDAGLGDMKATEEMKPRLFEIGKAIERFDEECKMHSGKVESIEQYFCKGASVETLREKLYSAYPEYAPEEIARSTANQDQESLQTVERLQYISNYSNEFFAEHNNKVDDSFYHDTNATSTPLKEKLTSAAISAVQNPSKKKKTSHRISPKALDLPPGEYVLPQGFPAHNDVPENVTPIYGTAQATTSTGVFEAQDADTCFAPFPSDHDSYDYAIPSRPRSDDLSFLSNAKQSVGALVSTVPVSVMDYLKTVPFEIKRDNLLACQTQMCSWVAGLLDDMNARNARLEVLETASAEANSAKLSKEVAQNKVKMLEIELTTERHKGESFGKLMEEQTRAWNLEKTLLMTQLNHAEKEIRDLKKRLEASGASSSQAPTGSFGA